MKTIEGATVLATLPVSGLRQVRDLIYVDGPLLSEFVHPKGDSYLYYWCDCDESGHRWMVIRVSEFHILQLRYQIIPLDLVIPSANLDDYVYFVDSVDEGVDKVWLSPNESIPADYLPGKGAYLEDECEEDPDHFSMLLDGDIGTKELFGIPRLAEQLYSFQYFIDVLGINQAAKPPWHSELSSYHFENWLLGSIPYGDRLHVDRSMVASPMVVRFNASHKVFDRVTDAVDYLIANRRDVREADTCLQNFISTIETSSGPRAVGPSLLTQSSELEKHLENFLDKFFVLDKTDVMEMTSSVLEAAQVSRWYYSRVKKLARSVESGNVKLPPTISRDLGDD